MILKSAQDYTPHAAGIFPAVCVDMIDLGIETIHFRNQQRDVPRVRLIFETMADDGTRGIIGRSFTASLHSKAKLAEFLGRWRGRPVVPGDAIDLSKLPGVCCTLVISHIPRQDGQGLYAGIDAVSRATRQVTPSGTYDPAAERQRISERKATQGNGAIVSTGASQPSLGFPAVPSSPAAGRDAFHSVPSSTLPALAMQPAATEEDNDDVPF